MLRARHYGVIAALMAVTSSAFLVYNRPTTTAPEPVAADGQLHAALPAPSTEESAPSTEPPSTAPSATHAPAPQQDLGVGLAVADAAAGDSSVSLGVAILDLSTGQLISGSGGATPFYSASLSKLLLVVDMLDLRAAGNLELSDDDLGLVERALAYSDDSAMDVLWTRFDGMAAIDRVAQTAGLSDTRAPDDSSQWGEARVSANDMVRLYQYIVTKMPRADRELIVDALSSAQEEAADGSDQFFGLLDGAARGSRTAYAKQGWMYYQPSDVYLHSAGVVDHRYAVAVLTEQTNMSEEEARMQVERIVATVLEPLPAS
jgi:beta-lactamase class A